MNKETKELLEKCPPSNLLFGPDLTEKVKTAKSIQAASKDLKAVPSTSGFNKPVQKKGGGRQSRGQSYNTTPHNTLNRFRPIRPLRETGSKGRISRDSHKDRYKKRK
nr:unnamed protein product [Callosobruchus analis]